MLQISKTLLSTATAILVITVLLATFPPLGSDPAFGGSKAGADWPMWRYDAARSGTTPHELPAELHLQWVRELRQPAPAWPVSQDRLLFDTSYEPVVAGGLVFVPSMVADRITAYDVETGAERWRFYTDGPVRFAPACHRGKLYAVSDDGYLYCLDASSGRQEWRFRGGSLGNRIVGNHRLISTHPARGGPVVYDGKVYFAAGIYPFMGTFLHSLDARTGEVEWSNSGSGSVYIMQPHSSPAFAGVSPQGYLAATQQRLVVPGGRSVPACYDRATGEFLYHHAVAKRGSYQVSVVNDMFCSAGFLHSLNTGKRLASAPWAPYSSEAAYAMDGDDLTVSGLPLAKVEYTDRRGKKRHRLELKPASRTKLKPAPERVFIKAGGHLYGGDSDGTVMGIDLRGDSPSVSWRGKVAGRPWRMLAASGKLLVVTREGGLFCFGGKQTQPKRYDIEKAPEIKIDNQWTADVQAMLEQAGAQSGYCIALGIGSGRLVDEIVAQSGLKVIVVESDSAKLEAFRRRMDAAGLYGMRVAAVEGGPLEFPFPPYLADLVVSERFGKMDFEAGEVSADALFEVLRPYGGSACFPVPSARHEALAKWVEEAGLEKAALTRSDGITRLTREGALPGSADWTHQYGDAANTVFSPDRAVRAPLGLLWFGGPPNDKILPRHGHGPSPQVVGGRIFIEGRDILRAMDVYTGRLLWERELKDIGKFYDRTVHQPGANEIGSNYASASDGIYVITPESCLRLDPATGKVLDEFVLRGDLLGRGSRARWGSVRVLDDMLVATCAPIAVSKGDRHPAKPLSRGTKFIISRNEEWRYLAGSHPDAEAADNGAEWTDVGFRAKGWKTGRVGLGYGDKDDKTVLDKMKDNYTVVYARKTFIVDSPDETGALNLLVSYDDAFIAYLNGEEVIRAGVGEGRGKSAKKIKGHEARDYECFEIEGADGLLVQGKNVLAIEGHNHSKTSSDFSLDAYLVDIRPDGGRTSAAKTPETAPATLLRGIAGVTFNSVYASSSATLLGMDRHSGELLWARPAAFGFRHNAIAAAAGKVFCIDKLSKAKLSRLRRRGYEPEEKPVLYALDARSGEVVWHSDKDIFGTWLGYSKEYDVLLQAGSRAGDRAGDEVGSGLAAYRGANGKVIWRNSKAYSGPPILRHDMIITQTGGANTSAKPAEVFSLLTGEQVTRKHPMTGETIPWTWVRFKGCNTAIASEHLMTFRSASAAYIDLTRGQGTTSIGGFKSGCTSNLIVANWVLNAPDYTRTCTCSYQVQASLALIHMPELETWSFDSFPPVSEPAPVNRAGINLGAPGNRYSGDGTLWLEFPSVGGPSPDLPVRVLEGRRDLLRCHNTLIDGDLSWVAASAAEGVEKLAVRSFLQPGGKAGRAQAFKKYAGHSPSWKEKDIKGSFEEPAPYTVRLVFAELRRDVKPGERVFSVSLQGETVLGDFDIARAAGGTHRGIVKTFKGVMITDDLVVSFNSSRRDALISGIELIAETPKKRQHESAGQEEGRNPGD